MNKESENSLWRSTFQAWFWLIDMFAYIIHNIGIFIILLYERCCGTSSIFARGVNESSSSKYWVIIRLIFIQTWNEPKLIHELANCIIFLTYKRKLYQNRLNDATWPSETYWSDGPLDVAPPFDATWFIKKIKNSHKMSRGNLEFQSSSFSIFRGHFGLNIFLINHVSLRGGATSRAKFLFLFRPKRLEFDMSEQ